MKNYFISLGTLLDKQSQNIAFTVALGCLCRGCYLLAPAAGWIIPSVVVLFVVVKGYRPEVKTDA